MLLIGNVNYELDGTLISCRSCALQGLIVLLLFRAKLACPEHMDAKGNSCVK
jgi:hypothetical protein